MTKEEVVTEEEGREWLDVHLLVIPDEMEVRFLGDDNGALDEALAVQRADVARAACKPEKGENIAQAGNIEIACEVGREICRGDITVAWQLYK